MGFPVKDEDSKILYVTKESDGNEGEILIDANGQRYVPAIELGHIEDPADNSERDAAIAEAGLDRARVEATGHEPQKKEAAQIEQDALHGETLAQQAGLPAPERSDVRKAVAEGADGEEAAEEAAKKLADDLSDDEDIDPVDLGLSVDDDEEDEDDAA